MQGTLLARAKLTWIGAPDSTTAEAGVPTMSQEARIRITHRDTSPIPAGYRLNRAMASIRRRMFFPPLLMVVLPGVFANRSLAMDSRIRP